MLDLQEILQFHNHWPRAQLCCDRRRALVSPPSAGSEADFPAELKNASGREPVICPNATLLKGFDIFREAGSGPLVKSFQHVEPTPQGKIEIYFTPAVNYPSISALKSSPNRRRPVTHCDWARHGRWLRQGRDCGGLRGRRKLAPSFSEWRKENLRSLLGGRENR